MKCDIVWDILIGVDIKICDIRCDICDTFLTRFLFYYLLTYLVCLCIYSADVWYYPQNTFATAHICYLSVRGSSPCKMDKQKLKIS